MQPIEIPSTTPTRYLSFNRALNVRLQGELTGDWHFEVAFFSDMNQPVKAASLAGEGEKVDTTPSLGELGVRDMGSLLAQKKVKKLTGPVYVANHFRAIADLAMLDFKLHRVPGVVTPETVNQWLDTESQVETLVEQYLTPLRRQLSGTALEAFEVWLPTIRYS